MSKVERHKSSQINLGVSGITSKGEPILSRLTIEPNPEDVSDPYQVTYTMDASDVIEIMRFLDERGPLMHATPSLRKATEDMREALMDIFKAVTPNSRSTKDE